MATEPYSSYPIRRSGFALIVLCLFCFANSVLYAQDKTPVLVVVSVDGMSCAGCAKKVGEAVAKVEGVESAIADAATKTLKYTVKADKKVSPKGVWEAVEKSGYTPTKIEGPDGKFEKKPSA